MNQQNLATRRSWVPAIARWGCIGLLVVACRSAAASRLLTEPRPDGSDPNEVTEEDVRAMLDSIVGTLLQRHHPSRHWEPVRPPSDQSGQPTGRTALAVLALLDAGLPAQTPSVAAAIDWMSATPADGTYAIAARLMVWCRLPGRDRERHLEHARLLERFSPEGGGWDYGPSPRLGFIDQSLTQFGLQAIAEADQRGLAVPDRLLQRIRDRFLATQNPDGGWGYRRRGDPSRGSMTAAGVASLALVEHHLRSNRHERKKTIDAMSMAVEWLATRFDADVNPGCPRWHLYWIHALERAARATGLQRLGTRDWFQESAAMIRRRLFLVEPSDPPRVRGEPRIDRLSFALLVLLRGLEPVAFACLDVDGGPPIDDLLGGACRLVSDRLERPTGWVRVGRNDPPGSWRRFPVLVVRSPPEAAWLTTPDSALARRISDFAASGGLVIALPSAASHARTFPQRVITAMAPLTGDASPTAIARDDPVRRRAGRWRFDTRQIGSSLRRWCVTARVPLRPGGLADRIERELEAMLASICLDRTEGRLPCRAPSSHDRLTAMTSSRPASQDAIRRIEWPGDGLVEPAVLQAWHDFERAASTPAADSGRHLVWLSGTGDADPADLGAPSMVFDPSREFLVVEAMSLEFRAAFLAWIRHHGWRGGLPPAGAPSTCAGIHDDQRCIGVIIDDRPARRLLAIRTPADFTARELQALHRSIEAARRIEAPASGE